MSTLKRSAARRGVLLLIVLSMLAMFSLLGIGFVVITANAKRSAKTIHRVDQQAHSPREDIHRALMQVARGSRTTGSVLSVHSLLEDLYGGDSVEGQVPNVLTAPWVSPDSANSVIPSPTDLQYPYWMAMRPRTLAGGQIVEFTIRDSTPQRFVGRLISFSGGPLAGVTTRVVGVRQALVDLDSDATTPSIPLTWLDEDPDAPFDRNNVFGLNGSTRDGEFPGRPVWKLQVHSPGDLSGTNPAAFLGNRILINGAPFSGTGAGLPDLNAVSPDLNTLLNAGYTANLPYALLPNPTVADYHANGVLSANEEYDAVDYQNMLLAMVLANGQVPSPSLHRPALINFWFHRMVTLPPSSNPISWPSSGWTTEPDPFTEKWKAVFSPWGRDGIPFTPDDWAPPYDKNLNWDDQPGVQIVTLKRAFMLRPLPEDHPDFNGGNARREAILGALLDTKPATLPNIDVNPTTGEWMASATGIPTYWETAGPWDVDNDADGIADSIWVDPGLPVRSTPDGRKYKPLVAILCTDLDGRLNLNAHGCSEQLRSRYTGNVTSPNPVDDTLFPVPFDPSFVYPSYPYVYAELGNVDLPRGGGYGPAEISLRPLLLSPLVSAAVSAAQYRNLLLGNRVLNGRYGESNWRLPPPLFYGHLPAPGRSQTDAPLALPFDGTPFNDPLSANMLYGLAGNYFNSVLSPAGSRTEYGSPADLKGTMTVGLDHRGQPIYGVTRSMFVPGNPPSSFVEGWRRSAFDGAGVNDPYETDLSRTGAEGGPNRPASGDDPFKISELERVLRPLDVDAASLPDRLLRLAPLLAPQPGEPEDRRHKVTTESWDLPCPPTAMPTELFSDFRNYLAADLQTAPPLSNPPTARELKEREAYRWARRQLPPRHVTDILVARLYVELHDRLLRRPVPTDPPKPLSSAELLAVRDAIERALPTLTSADLLAGLKMDLNRPFGNGLDDDRDGVVDDPSERFDLLPQFPAGNPRRLERLPMRNANGNSVPIAQRPLFDHDNDGYKGPDEHDPAMLRIANEVVLGPFDPYAKYRQAFARHLYVLMMALTDADWYPPWIVPPPDRNRPNQYEPSEHESARARAIAQWAINVVDFRDRDSIMTPFEYDIFPFTDDVADVTDPNASGYNPTYWGTWEVDGRIQPDNGIPGGNQPWESPDDLDPRRGLVWGCERPELLITETLAFHDMRTENLAVGGLSDGMPGGDDDLDQQYQPQGSLFIELFNPWPANEPRSGEFSYNRNSNFPGPAAPVFSLGWKDGVVLNQVTPRGHPVWRMIIVGPALKGGPGNFDDLDKDPDDPVSRNRPDIERSVYFVDPGTSMKDGTQYFTTEAITPILPNRYAVVGSRDDDPSATGTTYVGFKTGTMQGTTSTRRITLSADTVPDNPDPDSTVPFQVEVWGTGTQDDLDRQAGLPVGPQTRDAIRRPVAVPIGEPPPSSLSPRGDRRLSVSEPTRTSGYYSGFSSKYLASKGYSGLSAVDLPADGFDSVGDPVRPDGVSFTEEKIHYKYRVVHLQRLADPLRDYDYYDNPYRTIDTAQIDLTVFNGVPTPPSVPPLPSSSPVLISRERGETAGENKLWARELPGDDSANLSSRLANRPYGRIAISHFFTGDFHHTLGYLNEVFGDPRIVFDPANPTTTGPPGYKGDRQNNPADPLDAPFPWMTWNNRPLVSHLELLMVPAMRSSQLLAAYSTAVGSPDPYRGAAEPFGHLLNFFYSDETATDPPPAHFYRLLDFVHVPSRFVGTRERLDPSGATGGPHGHHPPFHWISRYREPGRINLNTLFARDVYYGLMNDFPGLETLSYWKDQFLLSRRDYPASSSRDLSQMMWLDSGSPTRFANPFRSFSGNTLVPISALNFEIDGGVNAGLARADDPATTPRPLFAFDNTFTGSSNQINNPDRNPFFRYQGLQRLGNLVTTRSNVYAIWITVGYFEVTPKESPGGPPVDRNVYLEGYTLGRELGADTGEVERHRAFYVFDRSIPVAFERGRDHNVEKAIVLKRFIE